MRICIFARSMARHSTYHTPALARVGQILHGLGHEVTALTTALRDGSSGVFVDDGIETHHLAGTEPGKSGAAFWTESARAFDRLHAARRFDLVIGRGTSTWGFFTQSTLASGVPAISHQGTYPRWLHQLETRAGRLGRWLAWPLAPAFALKDRRFLRCQQRSARVICITPQLAEGFARACWWHPPRTVWLTYGMDLAAFHPRPPPTDAPPRLISVGRLTWDKGIIPMIDMLAALQNRAAVLEMVGPASDRIRAAVLAHAAARGVTERYSAPGPVPNPEVPARMAGAVAFIFPSTHAEGLGKVVLEAMASGLPVVAYRLPVLEGLVEDGVTGWLVPIRSVSAITERVDRLLADPMLGARMGAAARAKIEAEFRPDVVLDRWQALLSEVVAEGGDR
jgi:glycosyltransferase involved in cell wall biosynthesis